MSLRPPDSLQFRGMNYDKPRFSLYLLKTSCLVFLLFVAASKVRSATLNELYPFAYGSTNADPNGLVFASDGLLYGTTANGGLNGFGTIFRISTNGVLTNLFEFADTNGSGSSATLTEGPDKAFYGTTLFGGKDQLGTIFRVTTNGQLSTVFTFFETNGVIPKGAYPRSSLVHRGSGAFVGTTLAGGQYGYGSVFEISTNGALTTLHSFNGTNDGAFPYAGVTIGADNAYYGTTSSGGEGGYGTIYRLTTNGLHTNLVHFNGTNGAIPYAGLTVGHDAALYGTCNGGGINDYGTIFKVTTNGLLTTLEFFQDANGAYPYADLTRGTDGTMYGTTSGGGFDDNGTVFQITTNGVLSTLAFFHLTNGIMSRTPLTWVNGVLYGTTFDGGSLAGGNIFKLTLGSNTTNVLNGVMLPLVRSGNGWMLRLSGASPGATYQFQRATEVIGPWTIMTNIIAGQDGTAQALDSAPHSKSSFYRTFSQ
jgi:uncharacterized repeat protein (TIGR03803 family)